MNPRASVGLATLFVNLFDFAEQLLILQLAMARTAMAPRIVALAGDAYDFAHRLDRELAAVRLDEFVPHARSLSAK